MKITPITAGGQPIGSMGHAATEPPNLRSMRMNTQATPGHVDQPIPTSPPGPDAAPLTISDPSDQASGDEATKPLSPQYAALARERRALQVKEREIAAREQALSGKQPAGSVPIEEFKSNPLKVMLDHGVTYEQLTQAILADQSNPEISALQKKVDTLETGFDKKLQDREAQAEQQVLTEMRREATQLATTPDFELVAAERAVPTVMQLIEKTYRKTGEVLDVKEAMQLVEDELLATYTKAAQFKKVQERLAPPPAPPAQPKPWNGQQMRTLTNRDTATAPMSAKARALAAFQGTLKR